MSDLKNDVRVQPAQLSNDKKELEDMQFPERGEEEDNENQDEEEIGTFNKIKGMLLFSLALAIYSTASLLVKASMETYFLTPQESLYYVSLMVLLCFYGSIITNK